VQSASMEILHYSGQCVFNDVYHGCFNVSLKFYNRVCIGTWYPSETPYTTHSRGLSAESMVTRNCYAQCAGTRKSYLSCGNAREHVALRLLCAPEPCLVGKRKCVH
jgi:hypothetical protein